MISDQEAYLSQMITQSNGQTRKQLDDFMAVDPFPQERIDKMKKNLKIEIKNEIYNASPLLRNKKDTSMMDSADDLDAKQMQELSGMSGQNNGPDIAEHIAKVMESTQKKLDKLDEHVAEREKVMEAKLRRTMKEG